MRDCGPAGQNFWNLAILEIKNVRKVVESVYFELEKCSEADVSKTPASAVPDFSWATILASIK